MGYSPLEMEYKDNHLDNFDSEKDPVRTDSASPYITFFLHLLNIAEVRVYRKKPNYIKDNLGIAPRYLLQNFENAWINS